jgi:hypothetical protein
MDKNVLAASVCHDRSFLERNYVIFQLKNTLDGITSP